QRQQVSFGIEDVVLGRDRRATKRTDVRTIDAGLRRRQLEPAHVEVVLAALERLNRKERIHELLRIGAELWHLRGRVAFADEEDVHLLRRRTALEQRPDGAGFGWIGAI